MIIEENELRKCMLHKGSDYMMFYYETEVITYMKL
jgi:hypothetical protein